MNFGVHFEDIAATKQHNNSSFQNRCIEQGEFSMGTLRKRATMLISQCLSQKGRKTGILLKREDNIKFDSQVIYLVCDASTINNHYAWIILYIMKQKGDRLPSLYSIPSLSSWQASPPLSPWSTSLLKMMTITTMITMPTVMITHYMRAYFNYQALVHGREFSLPGDAGIHVGSYIIIIFYIFLKSLTINRLFGSTDCMDTRS